MTQEWTLTDTLKGELLDNKTHAIFFRFILVRMKTYKSSLRHLL